MNDDATDTREHLDTSEITLEELAAIDDSIFNDGSIPTSWENAGINDPKALKYFIKKLILFK